MKTGPDMLKYESIPSNVLLKIKRKNIQAWRRNDKGPEAAKAIDIGREAV